MKDTVKVEWHICVGLVGCDKSGVEEFDREEWECMSEEDREEAMRMVVYEEIEWSWEEL